MDRVTYAVILLLAAVAAPCFAQDNTKGMQLSSVQGYTFGSEVGGYLTVSKDVCEFKAALAKSPPDYDAAKKIYQDGKNSKKSDGSMRTLRGMASDSYAGEPFFDNYTTYFGSAAFLDKFVMDALNGNPPFTKDSQRTEAASKSVESTLQMVYLMHELDEAAGKIMKNDLSASKGAPHNIDETWALYVGEDKSCGLYDQGLKRAVDFGTLESCTAGKSNSQALAAHQKMYQASLAGDIPRFEAARQEMVEAFLITYLQSTLKYAKMMDQDLAAGKDPSEHQAEGFAFFRTIQPLVARADNKTAKAIHDIFYPGNAITMGTTESRVRAALEPLYPELGVTKAEIGTYGNIQPLNATCGQKSAAEGVVPYGLSSSWVVLAVAGVFAVFGMLQ